MCSSSNQDLKVIRQLARQIRKPHTKEKHHVHPHSVKLLNEWHNHNGFHIETERTQEVSITEALDQILSKKLTKKNTIIFYGESNAGKSIVMNSAFLVFADVAHMYQGIANNFMFEVLKDAEVCLRQEALFAQTSGNKAGTGRSGESCWS